MDGWRLVVTALLVGVAASSARAQESPDSARSPGPDSVTVSETAAAVDALARVREDLRQHLLGGWSSRLESRLLVASNRLWLRDGSYLYVVAIACPEARGHVRVLMDARTGKPLSVLFRPVDWSASPDWWMRGLDRAPR